MLLIDLDSQCKVSTALNIAIAADNIAMRYLLHGDDYRDSARVNDRGPYLGVRCIHRCERRTATGPGKVGWRSLRRLIHSLLAAPDRSV